MILKTMEDFNYSNNKLFSRMLKLADTAQPKKYITADDMQGILAQNIGAIYDKNMPIYRTAWDLVKSLFVDGTTMKKDVVNTILQDQALRNQLVGALKNVYDESNQFNYNDPSSAAARGGLKTLISRLDYPDSSYEPYQQRNGVKTFAPGIEDPVKADKDYIRSYNDLMQFGASYKNQLKENFSPNSNYANAVAWKTNNYLNEKLNGMSAWQRLWIGIQKFLSGLGFSLPKDWSYSQLTNDVSNYGKKLVNDDMYNSTYNNTIQDYQKAFDASNGTMKVNQEIINSINQNFAKAINNSFGNKNVLDVKQPIAQQPIAQQPGTPGATQAKTEANPVKA